MRFAIREGGAGAEELAAVQAESWRDVYRGAFPDAWLDGEMETLMRQEWDRTLSDHPPPLTAWADRSLIGFAALELRDDTGYLDHLHVRPALRRAGVGSALLRAAAERIANSGRDALWLWVIDRNPDAIRFYEARGARRTGGAVNTLYGHRQPCIRMAWDSLAPLTARFRAPVPPSPARGPRGGD